MFRWTHAERVQARLRRGCCCHWPGFNDHRKTPQDAPEPARLAPTVRSMPVNSERDVGRTRPFARRIGSSPEFDSRRVWARGWLKLRPNTVNFVAVLARHARYRHCVSNSQGSNSGAQRRARTTSLALAVNLDATFIDPGLARSARSTVHLLSRCRSVLPWHVLVLPANRQMGNIAKTNVLWRIPNVRGIVLVWLCGASSNTDKTWVSSTQP